MNVSSVQLNFELINLCQKFSALDQTFESINKRGLTASDERIRNSETGLVIGFRNYRGLTPLKSVQKFSERMDEIRKTFFSAYDELEKAKLSQEESSIVYSIISDLRKKIDFEKETYLYLEDAKIFKVLKTDFVNKIDGSKIN